MVESRRDAVDLAIAVVLAADVVLGSASGIARNTANLASLSVSGSPPAGGSIAAVASSCIRWLTTTSRSAPTGS